MVHCFSAFSSCLLTLLLVCLQVPSIIKVEATAVHVPKHYHGKKMNFCVSCRGGAGEVASSKAFRRFAEDSRMPSLFLPEESLYERYAACLAATEGLRRIRDRDLAEEEARQRQLKKRQASNNSSNNLSTSLSSRRRDVMSDRVHEIESQYVKNSERVLRALGLSVHRFNELGKEVSEDPMLRERVSVCQAALHATSNYLVASVSPDLIEKCARAWTDQNYPLSFR